MTTSTQLNTNTLINTLTPTSSNTADKIIHDVKEIPNINIIVGATLATLSICLLAGLCYCYRRFCHTRRVRVRRGDRIELQSMR